MDDKTVKNSASKEGALAVSQANETLESCEKRSEEEEDEVDEDPHYRTIVEEDRKLFQHVQTQVQKVSQIRFFSCQFWPIRVQNNRLAGHFDILFANASDVRNSIG